MTDIDLSLLPDYLVEAAEHLEEMESLLLQLAAEPDSTELMNEIFRPIHSIKGAAQFIGLERSSRLAHRLEDLLDLLRKGEHPPGTEVVELLISARDLIVNLAEELESTQTETSSVDDMVALITAEIDRSTTQKSVASPETAAIENAVIESESKQAKATNTTYEEENDQELFGIFLENMREKIDLVHTQATELEHSADKVALLERCAENIQGLQAAANYMGYDELTTIYSNWHEDITEVQAALGRNEEVPYDFMDGYLAEIFAIFPQLAPQSELQPELRPEPQLDQQTISIDAEQEVKTDESSDVDVTMLPDYLVEAAEHLEEMESLLLKLVAEPDSTELMNEIFRPIHSIKGAAQFIGLQRSSRLAHRLEDLLDLLRKGEHPPGTEVVELLISARDLIVKLAEELENTQTEVSSVDDMVALITAEIDGSTTQKSVVSPETTAAIENAVIESESKQAKATNTTYEEENDQELFGIFLENMREKIDLVRTQAVELEHSADKVALLERCAENIQALQSAANYMGYDELTTIYSNWHEDIVEVQGALGRNEEVPYDFMDGYLAEIFAIFPQLAPQSDSQPLKSDAQQGDSKQTDEEKLYQKLSNALDTDASRSEGVEYELLHGVFEEMISEKQDAPVEKRPAEKSPVEKQVAAAVSNKKQETSNKPAAKTANAKAQPSDEKQKVSKKGDAGTTADTGKKPQQAETGKQVKAKKNQANTASGKTNETTLKKNVRVEAEKIDSLINQVGELVVDRAYFFQLFDDLRGLQQHFKDDIGLDQKEMKQVRAFTYRMGEAIASLSRTSNDLQEGVMKIRMLPISQLFNRYPRLVHDLTRNNSKKVNLRVEGENTELDKMVVEKLSDPLIHIIRNAIDHGLEDAKDRAGAGKPETGTLFLRSYHESNQVVVEIMDDGRGIDPVLVKNKAIEKGVVSKNEADRMTPQEIIRLITAAGFSTADEITDTSGRGVGMDVVRKNIEKLNGTLEIESRVGQGTSIRLKIPLTLAIIQAHLVRVSGNMYTIPLANIEETLRIRKEETTVIEGTEVVYLRGKTLPVIHLSGLFNTHSPNEDTENFFVVVVNTGTQKIGLVVDELLGQEEVVIKPLEDYLRDQTGFSGATIIGDGSISLILDIYEVANMMASEQIRRQQERNTERKSAGAA